MSRRPILVLALAPLVLAAACKKTPRGIGIDVTPGLETGPTGAFRQDPPVTTVTITAFDASKSPVAQAAGAPGGDFSLGEFQPTDFVQVEVTGTTAAGDAVVRGRTMGVELDNFAGDTLPVFVQRVGQWARPGGQLLRARIGAVAGSLNERYLVLTGGDSPALSYFDMLSLSGFDGGSVTRADGTAIVAQSLVVVGGSAVLAIGPSTPGGSDVAATWTEFGSTPSVHDAEPPPGMTFAEVAGGAAIKVDPKTGDFYVVGATRLGAATDKVLHVAADANRTLTAFKLATKRRGAAAAMVKNVGLVVAGGNPPGVTGPLVTGVETLAVGATAFTTRPFAPDTTFGAAGVDLGNGDKLILVGGTRAGKAAPTRIVASACITDCDNGTNTQVVHPEGLGAPLVACSAYQPSSLVELIACDEPKSGETLTYTLSLAGGHALAPLPLRDRRKGATVTDTPLGTLALLGGLHLDGTPALTVELLYPP